MSFIEAKKTFGELVGSLAEGKRPNNSLTCEGLMDLFLEWIKEHRSPRTFDRRTRDCNRTTNFRARRGKRLVANIPATGIVAADLEDWFAQCREKGESPQTLLHRKTSIKHC